MRKRYKTFIYITLISTLCALLSACDTIRGETAPEPRLDTVHSGSSSFTDFDNWLRNEVGLLSVPTHMMIRDGKITNLVSDTINYENLMMAFEEETMSIDAREQQVGEYSLGDYDLVLVTEPGCEWCEEQEKFYEAEILEGFKDKRVLIYYILSENSDSDCMGQDCG